MNLSLNSSDVKSDLEIGRLIDNRYEIIPLHPRDKRPIGDNWQKLPISVERIAEARRSHGAINIGCLTGKLMPIDIDVWEDHPKFAAITQAITDTLGESPLCRWGRKGCMLLYRAASEPMSKQHLDLGSFDYDAGDTNDVKQQEKDKHQAIEVLGLGQQVVFFGVHPLGKDYVWGPDKLLGPDPFEVPLADLPAVTPEMIEKMLATVAAIAGVTPPSAANNNDHTPSAARGKPVSLAHIQTLLSFIDPGSHRNDWAVAIAATRACNVPEDPTGEIRLEYLDAWSERSPAKYDGREKVVEVWKTMAKPEGAGYGKLLYLAQRAGYGGGPYKPPGSEVFAHVTANVEGTDDKIIWPCVIGEKQKPDPKHIENVKKLISRLGAELRRNIFTDTIEIGHGQFEECSEAQMDRIWAAGNSWGLRASIDDLRRNIGVLANQTEFHPVRAYLEALRWDGISRADTWLATYAGAVDNPLHREFGRVTLVGAVRRVLEPGCKFDHMLVLDGPQNAGKSTLFRILAGTPWFTDCIRMGTDSKVMLEQTRGVWLAECAELTSQGTVEAAKAQITTQYDHARMAYRRDPVKVGRQFIIVGTTNDTTYLKDHTGNRRFLPVTVGKIDLEGMARDRDQLWAEAYHRVVEDQERPIIAAEFHLEASKIQASRVIKDPLRAWLGEAFEGLEGRVAKEDVWVAYGRETGASRTFAEANTLTAAMRELGWEAKQMRRGGPRIEGYVKGTGGGWLRYEKMRRIFLDDGSDI